MDQEEENKYTEDEMCRSMAENERISLIMEDGVFGMEQNNFISKNDISHFCLMNPISSICISIYMRHLWSVLQQKNKGHLYGFVDPSHISQSTGKIEARSNALSHRFESAHLDQLFFAPYNTGNHWLLVVINPLAALVYNLDPLSDMNVNLGMKNVIEIAMKIFYAQKGVNSRKKIHWQVIQCPSQARVEESGYYIMKYMKDIIGTSINTIKDKEKNSYTQAEIDEVRVEWAEVVDSYIQANEV
ncbi:unnamed protein product [Cuscuta campestris]|uniref:Ubiquitin-like protease family profile domain-containing protein n=1 Tax=Cuscuta campestris TaxID=132261 RepID=A0A484MCX4_9ASTE|nr:unnamed protein product [Cuscuta campestris]